MGPRHHPSDATLLSYAAGGLGEGLALVVASHLAFCAACRDGVAAGETMGGGLLDTLQPEPLAPDSRDRMLALLDRPAPAPVARPVPPADPDLPAPLGRYLGRGLNQVDWRLLAPGIRHVELVPHGAAGGANLRLLRIGPGRKLLRHGHRGTELTLVLQGYFTDELGRFERGDVAETDAEIVHEPASGTDRDCVCLIATEAPLKFSGLLGRVVQRFTGF